MAPERFFLGVRIFNDTRRFAPCRAGALARSAFGRSFKLTPASEDASCRYWRATLEDGRTFVAMDAPPDKEDCRPFVRVARMLAAAGVHAPEVIRAGSRSGIPAALRPGSRTYLEALNEATAAALFADATDALLRWQLATTRRAAAVRRGSAAAGDEPLPEWYVARHLRKNCPPRKRSA